jgi:hypothetical protein
VKRILLISILLVFVFSAAGLAQLGPIGPISPIIKVTPEVRVPAPQPAVTQVYPPIPMTLGAHGGAGHMTGSDLLDIKGQPVIGVSAAGPVTGYWGAGYWLWMVSPEGWTPPTPPSTYELEDTGWIRNTQIELVGDAVSITWDYDPGLGQVNVQLYGNSGNDAEFDTAASWTAVGPVQLAGDTEYTVMTAGTNPKNYYFRVVPDPLPGGTTIFSKSNNSITVGTVKVNLSADLYVFVGLPFMEDNISLAGLLGDQLDNGDEFLWWDGAGYQGATYSSGWTGTDRDLRVGEGFIVRGKGNNKLFALLGRFGSFTTPCVLPLTANQYALVDYPYPTAKNFQGMGVPPGSGDDLIKWIVYLDPQHKQYYDGATWNGSAWAGPAGIDDVELARPRFYRPKSSFNWTINLP